MAAETAYRLERPEKRLTLWYIAIGFAHLAVGILMGFLQGMEHAGINLYDAIPLIKHYYQGLSIHGVFNVLVFTTFFIAGFLTFVTSYGLERPMHSRTLSWITFGVMLVGLLMVDWSLLTNRASVLYTSYAPLKAHPAYYIGLALIVVGTLLLLANMVMTYLGWRRDNPDKRTPLMTFGALTTVIMWGLASVGIVVQFLFLLIPWSLGWTDGVDPLFSRTLFWFSGHPIVYFWLLPAYISWYFLLPRQVGGKLFSEPLARLSFLLFIPLSLPVGFHHQFLDPGVSEGYKAVHALLTFAVFMPSMITAFTVLASIETGGRARGGRGLFGWIRALPWNDPSVTGQLLAMVLYSLGGISGLVNASYNLNLVVHNTLFVPGHFHLTVGTATALTFMAISYWLIPHLRERQLWSRKLALVQTWLWFFGMAFMSRGMSWAGIEGAPRRTALGASTYFLEEWVNPTRLAAIGGVLLTISGTLFFINLILTWVRAPRTTEVPEVPVAVPLQDEPNMPTILDRFKPWVVATVIIVTIAYGPTIFRLVTTPGFQAPGMSPF